MKVWIQNHKIEIFIFLLALFVRLFLFGINFSHNNSDIISTIHGDDGYYELSQGILGGYGFTWDKVAPFAPNPLRPPVWPFIIAGLVYLFKSYWAVMVFEIIIGSLTPVLGLIIVRKFFDRKFIWLGTAILMAMEPYSVLFSHILYTETMFIFLFLLFFIFLTRYFENKSIRNVVWMMVFLALATLVKPTVQYVPVILPLIMIWDSRKDLSKKVFSHVFLGLGIFMIMITPWLYRNYHEFGVVGMSAQPAFNLYVYLVPTLLAIDNNTNFNTELNNFVHKESFDINTITLSNSKLYTEKAVGVIKEHKLALVKSVGTTVVTFFTHDGMLTVLGYAGKNILNTLDKPVLTLFLENPLNIIKIISSYIGSWGSLILFVRLVWMVITLFFFVGIMVLIKRSDFRAIVITAVFLVAYFALTTSLNGLGVNARFRMPVNVFILSFALVGFLVVWDNIKNRFHKTHA